MSIGSFIFYELMMLSWILFSTCSQNQKVTDRQGVSLRGIILTSSSVVNKQTPVLLVFVVTQTVTVGLNTLKAVNQYGIAMSKHLYTLDFRMYVIWQILFSKVLEKKNYIVLKVISLYIFTVLVLEEQGVLLRSLLVWDNLKKNIL